MAKGKTMDFLCENGKTIKIFERDYKRVMKKVHDRTISNLWFTPQENGLEIKYQYENGHGVIFLNDQSI